MAVSAVARETLFALRDEIARIEGAPACFADADVPAGEAVLRRDGAVLGEVLETGIKALDAGLGGGLPLAGLSEIHAAHMRDAGLLSGFALCWAAMAARRRTARERPGLFLWICGGETVREGGLPYLPALSGHGLAGERQMLLCRLEDVRDALWTAEEAVRIAALCTIVLELRGDPRALDLTATRRLHLRAREAGRPLLLLRMSARETATAAPLRLLVSPAPSALRRTFAGEAVAASLGPPRFRLRLSKARAGPQAEFLLEWNADELAFVEAGPAHAGRVVSAPCDGPPVARPAGQVVAFAPPGLGAPAGPQPPRERRAARQRTRRAG